MRDIPLNTHRVLDAVHESLSKSDPLRSGVLARLAQRDEDRARFLGQERPQEPTLADQLDAMVEAVVRQLPTEDPAPQPTLTDHLSAMIAGNSTAATTDSVAVVVRRALDEEG